MNSPLPPPACPRQASARPDQGAVVLRFGQSVGGLLAMIFRLIGLRAAAPVPLVDLHRYIVRIRQRFERLIARLAAGTPPRIYPPRPVGAEVKPRNNPRLRLPTRKGWFGTLLGHNGRNFASQVQHLLNEPDVAALLAPSPQAHRLLRPFCRLLGIAPACIPPLPRRTRKPPPQPRPPRVRRLTRRMREAILWYPNSEGRPMKLLPRRLPRD